MLRCEDRQYISLPRQSGDGDRRASSLSTKPFKNKHLSNCIQQQKLLYGPSSRLLVHIRGEESPNCLFAISLTLWGNGQSYSLGQLYVGKWRGESGPLITCVTRQSIQPAEMIQLLG